MVLLDRVVAADEAGERVDVLLARWLSESRAQAQSRISAGEVRDGAGRALPKSHRAEPGERVVVSPPPQAPAPPVPEPVPVRYRDEHLAVVAKPAGLVVHRGAGTRRGATLVDVLTSMGLPLAPSDDPERPGIVHRLDRGTSGLLAVACSEEARRGLGELLRRHEVERRYWAIVDGVPDPPSAVVDAPIARSPRNRTRFRTAAGGRRAVSSYDLVASGPGASVLHVRLQTGRTHQVRVHMSALGHPVSGDRVYGASPEVAARLGLGRPALHAQRLAFRHPVTGAAVDVEEPLPADLREAQRRLLG